MKDTKHMKNKFWALVIVLGIYVFAAACAVAFVWLVGPYIENDLLLILAADIVATLIVFVFSIFFKNASLYDPYWSVAPPFIIAGYYFTSGATFSLLHLLFIIPLSCWAIRLTYNWCREFKDIKWQDWRYVRYKEQFPKIYLFINLTGIMLMPTLLVFAGTIPLYYLLTGTPNAIALGIGGVVILFATIYQATADYQLRKFRAIPENKGKCIDSGLWRYSRHPNYFAEITNWFGVFICSLPNFGWMSPVGCIAILLLFCFVSVPLMEGKMLKTHPKYKDYQKTVPSILFPFWRSKKK